MATAANLTQRHPIEAAVPDDHHAVLAEFSEGLAFPVPEIPGAMLADSQPAPLCDSGWDFAEQCRALIASKRYEDTG